MSSLNNCCIFCDFMFLRCPIVVGFHDFPATLYMKTDFYLSKTEIAHITIMYIKKYLIKINVHTMKEHQ